MTLWKSRKRREEEEQARRRWHQEAEERRRKEEAEETRWKELEAKHGVNRDEIQYQSSDGLLYWNPRFHGRQKLTPGHVGAIGLIEVNTGRNKEEEPYREHEVRFKWINEAGYVEGKENGNILTCGASGAGKSSLVRLLLRKMDGQQRIIFSFKANDTHLRIGYPVADVGELAPNPFRDAEAFVSAFAIAFPITAVGITASQVPSLVQELTHGCESWKDFNHNVERRIKETKDKVQLSALFFIQEQARSIEQRGASGSKGDLVNEAIRGGLDVVLDLSRLSDSAKTFYAELLLRGIWNWLPSPAETSKRTIVYVDEAHRLTRGTFEKYHSILNEMAREIRSRGALWTSTQNYSDIEDGIRNQFATQFVFRTSSKADLEALRAIDPMLPWTATELRKHRFVDAKARFIHEGMVVYTFAPDDAANDGQPQQLSQVIGGVPPSAVETPDYGEAVAEALANGAVWVSGLAGQISERNHVDKDSAKLRVRSVLLKLLNADEVGVQKYDDAETGETISLYFLKSDNESVGSLHRYMLGKLLGKLGENGVKILCVAEPGQRLPDVETESAYYEIETGLKTRTSDLEERISKLGSAKPFVVLVPNSDIAKSERYARLASPRVVVATVTAFLSEKNARP
jgi:hypothetical protein